jgi:hypothetical protein
VGQLGRIGPLGLGPAFEISNENRDGLPRPLGRIEELNREGL